MMSKQKLRELAQKATPGEWIVGECYADNGAGTYCGIYNSDGRDVYSEDGISEPDAEYIAAANPATILALLDENADQASAIETLEAKLQGAAADLSDARQNEITAMRWIADCRSAVGDDGSRTLPEFVKHLERMLDENAALLEALVSLATTSRRYLPDYDEHPEVQKADAAIAKYSESTS